jgi:hypothetical protein
MEVSRDGPFVWAGISEEIGHEAVGDRHNIANASESYAVPLLRLLFHSDC